MNAVECIALRRTFGSVVAVDSVDLTVGRGELFALVGPDGAGKTTLLRLLTCAMRPSGGTARVAGFDVVLEGESVKARVGYMPQRFSLYGDLSVDENIDFFSALHGISRGTVERESRALLDDFQLSPFRGRLARDLSGGMKQKAALACTLIHAPEILLLDEPTAGVDPVSRRQFWRILHDLNRRGITVVVSTPYMDEAEKAARVALMYGGRIVACDRPEGLRALVTAPIYEVIAEPKGEARRRLEACAEVAAVQPFGEAFHAVTVRDGVDAALRSALVGLDIRSLRRIPPSLEDVFIARLGAA